MSRAALEVDALVAAARVVLRGEPLAQLRVGGAQQRGRPMRSTPSIAARACARQRVSPRRVRSATLRRSRMSAARRMRSSSPSGSTMCRRSATRAVDQLVLEHQRRHGLGAGHLEPVEQRLAVDVLVEQRQRGGDLARRVLVEPTADRLERAGRRRVVSRSVATIGIVAPSPSMSRPTWSGSGKPPLSTMPDICGKLADTWAVSTPSTISGRSPGVTTSAPSKSRSRTWGSVIAATSTPVTSRVSSPSSPLTRRPVAGGHQVGDRRRAQQRLLGDRERRHVEADQRVDDRVAGRRVDAVGDDREQACRGGRAARPRPGRPRCAPTRAAGRRR